MIIKDIKLTSTRSRATLSANCKIRKLGWDKVYFSVDAKNKDYIYGDASPFAAALLIPAMMQGEDLVIKGSISKKLYENMQEVMREVPITWDKRLRPIRILPDAIVEDTTQADHVACFFTGGVDSFHTYLRHKNERAQSDRIDSFILVNGFDVHPNDTEVWNLALQNNQAIAKAEGVELVVVTSNLHQVLEPVCSWGEYNNGSCLGAIGLCLRNRFSKVYIASSYSLEQQKHYEDMCEAIGTTKKVDELWSSEAIQFVHDGADVGRREKVAEVVTHPIVLKRLRVCYVNKNNSFNCGSCDKCTRTMVNLYLAGALGKAETFPDEIDVKNVANVYTSPLYCECFYQENISELERRQLNPELQAAYRQMFARSVKRHEGFKNKLNQKVIHKVVRKLNYVDYAYFGGYAYQASAQLLGKGYQAYAYSVTESRPFTLRTTQAALAALEAK